MVDLVLSNDHSFLVATNEYVPPNIHLFLSSLGCEVNLYLVFHYFFG